MKKILTRAREGALSLRLVAAEKAQEAVLLGMLFYTCAREFVANHKEMIGATAAVLLLLVIVFACL